MVSRVLRFLSVFVLVAGAVTAGEAIGGAAKPVGACTLQGTANFSVPVTTKAKSATYTFTGTLSKCKSTGPAVTGGTITANGSGTVSCATSNTSGTANVTWNNGTTSGLTYTTTGAGSLVLVQGTVNSGTFAPSSAKGALSFTTTSPQACAGAGLSSLGFVGEVSLK